MGDALAVCLLEKRGFSEEDFLAFHPSGALGNGLLYTVSELMITGDKLPIAKEEEMFTDVIQVISAKKLGMAIITDKNGKMTGVLTDGDIRRTLIKHPDVKNLKVKDVMTVEPKTILPGELAAKALHLMEKYSITALAIRDENGYPAGVVHIHDLLKVGVA
ncbi:Arabinose 5-phosphate isomerase KdsD [bioreactor metagenome]|uniref:Arabinose 5-phosphate isomerase KdsD n=1 Tax=bioreactor metagenome TaxID=1076179 RepID=A0A645HRY3_9ZZZZ